MKKRQLLVVVSTTLLLLIGAMAGSWTSADMDGMDMGDLIGTDDGSSGSVAGMGKRLAVTGHMTMTKPRAATAADVARGSLIIHTMRDQLGKYQDYKVAEAAGYLPYLETVPQDIYHFTSKEKNRAEYLGDVDLKYPGSLLYEKKTFGGYKLVGAMYSAPATYTTAQLDQIIPLGLTRWHQHTNICLPAGITDEDVMNGKIIPRPVASVLGTGRHTDPRLGLFADPRFGFGGTIADAGQCEAVGGSFYPIIFGWMVHVYPFADTDDLKVVFGMDAP